MEIMGLKDDAENNFFLIIYFSNKLNYPLKSDWLVYLKVFRGGEKARDYS